MQSMLNLPPTQSMFHPFNANFPILNEAKPRSDFPVAAAYNIPPPNPMIFIEKMRTELFEIQHRSQPDPTAKPFLRR
jgi:hypothetical protein